MRPLELALIAALFPCVLLLLSPMRIGSIWLGVAYFLLTVLLLCHFLMEGQRWQMYPAYILVLGLACYEFLRWSLHLPTPYLVGVVALFCEGAAILLSSALPVFALPAPSGPYKVGTQSRHLVDRTRRDPLSNQAVGYREIMVQIWYPADDFARGNVAPYREKKSTTLWNARYAMVKTHSIVDAAVASSPQQFPVLLYLPSWRGVRTESTFLAEELASHGYVVVGLDHPYSSFITVFPDGRIARSALTVNEDYSSQSAFEAFTSTAEEQIEIRAHDAKFVRDELEKTNANDAKGILTGRLDLAHVGIYGYSLGGGVAMRASWLDRRLKAGVNMDGMVAADAAQQETMAPFLVMFADDVGNWTVDVSKVDTAESRKINFYRQQSALIRQLLARFGGYLVSIAGTTHSDFSDKPFFSPLRTLTHSGGGDAELTARITRMYALAFFNQRLKNTQEELLTGPPPTIPEVHFEDWNLQMRSEHR